MRFETHTSCFFYKTKSTVRTTNLLQKLNATFQHNQEDFKFLEVTFSPATFRAHGICVYKHFIGSTATAKQSSIPHQIIHKYTPNEYTPKKIHESQSDDDITSYSFRSPSQSFCLRCITYSSSASICMERSTSGCTTLGKGFFSSCWGGTDDSRVSATEDGVFSDAEPSTTPLSFMSELELSSGISTMRETNHAG